MARSCDQHCFAFLWMRGKLVACICTIPGDLNTRKRTGTSCQIEIHFSIKTTEYLLKYTLFRFQIYVRAIVLITKHD